MNHIYKIIWNKAKHCYTVVSEIAKSHSDSTKRVRMGTTAALMAVAVLTGFAMPAQAAVTIESDGTVKAEATDISALNNLLKGITTTKDGSVTVGGLTVKKNGEVSVNSPDVVYGKNAKITWDSNNTMGQISIGNNATAITGHGGQERAFAWDGDVNHAAGAIAIGTNTYARTGSIMIGSHVYKGNMGDVKNIDTDSFNTGSDGAYGFTVNSTTIGTNSFTRGNLATTIGDYNIQSGKSIGHGFSSWVYGAQNFGATVIGALNSNESQSAGSGMSGIANSIVGVANKVNSSNGTLVFGAGNEVTNSLSGIYGVDDTTSLRDAKKAQDALKNAVADSDAGGAVLAIGGANKADWAQKSQLIGVGNTLTGTSSAVSKYDMINGYKNEVTNAAHTSIIGSNNKAKNIQSTIVMGDNNTLEGRKNVISLGNKNTVVVDDAVAIGNGTTVSAESGVAIGVDSVANRVAGSEKGALGAFAPAGSGMSGIANSIVGVANKVNSSNGTLVFGAGNEVTNSLSGIYGVDDTTSLRDAKKAQDALKNAVADSDAGGAVLAIGGANKADWAQKSQLIGVGNTLTGTSSAVSKYDMINGYKNEVTNAAHTSIIGSNNKAKNIQSTIVMGDNNTLEGRKNVISLGNKNTVVVDDAVAIGNGTTVSAESGVAIGVDSVANRVAGSEKGALGAFAPANIPTTEKSTWTSTKGAVSVGDTANDITRQITNVAAGSEDTDAVNVAQLKQVASQAERAKTTVSDGTNTTVTSTVAEDGHTDYKVNLNKDLTGIESMTNGLSSIRMGNGGTVTINNRVTIDQSGKISGVAAGEVKEGSTDAVNGSQLHAVQQEAGKHTKVVNGSNITVEETDQDGQKTYKVGLNKDLLLGDITGKNVSISGTNGTIETTGSIATKDKIYADNGAKLADVNVTGDTISNDKSSVKLDKDGTVTINNKVTVDQNGKVSGVSAGDISDTSTDAVNGSQLKATNDRVSQVEGDITNIKSDITDIKGDVKNLGDRVTKVEQEAGKHTKVVNGSNITVEETDQDGQKTYKVGLNKDLLLGDITGKNVSISGTNGTIETTGSIATKDKIYADNGAKLADIDITGDTISNGQSSVKLDKEGTVTINGKVSVNQDGKVSGVAAGDISEKSTDAVNGSQLFATNQQVAQNAQSINKLGNRINKVGAGAAALAALHPLDFDPDDKWDFVAGYGNYNGENAAAIGAYYRPNEDTMFSVGGSFGNGENMMNAGVSLKLGQGNHVSTSKVAMAKEIKDLRKEMEGLKSALLDANAGKKLDTSKLQLFPDVPKNHWAYEYVSTLKGNGALTGYPDGEFKGDRPMTRYEFATMLYKAMLEGATLSDKILKEFAPELERFTVDTVHQDKDGKPTVERVRTVKAEK